MEEEDILPAIWDNKNEWSDEEIGRFVRMGITEDMTEVDILKAIGIRRR